jgi:hypothetical protein
VSAIGYRLTEPDGRPMLLDRLVGQAAAAFGVQVVLAHDLARIPVPLRRPSAP